MVELPREGLGATLIRRVPGWAIIDYNWHRGEIEKVGADAGRQFLAFDFTVTSNGTSGKGGDGVYARNDADNELFGEFNAVLDHILPPDPIPYDYRVYRPHCWDIPGWPRIEPYPHFCELQRRVVNSISFHTEFLSRGCFVRKKTAVSMAYDYVLYKDALWTLDRQDLSLDDCTSVIDEILRRERQKIDYFKNAAKVDTTRRERIPEDVRSEVWRRDKGQCARCGSRDRLEFDHIVAVSLGGGNTARNIELLCESCNRAKSNSI
jgi:GTPase SAR1 family protein